MSLTDVVVGISAGAASYDVHSIQTDPTVGHVLLLVLQGQPTPCAMSLLPGGISSNYPVTM